jgi:putative ABC transport system permease protein
MSNRPSHRALRFLEWFCPSELFEGIEGDLLERYEIECKMLGETRARRLLAWNVLKFFRPSILLRNKFSMRLNQTIMIRNYVKVASRNILKRKMYSFINAFGLSIGIAFCVLIYLFIEDEKSFDQFHVNKENLFRIEAKSFDTWNEDPEKLFQTHAWLQTGLKQVLKDELPEIELATGINTNDGVIFHYGGLVFTERVTFVDRDFFDMFSFPLLAGRKEKLFSDKSEVVITPEIAKKYFGTEDPLGKTITLDIQGEKSFTVSGIIDAPPANSSLDFRILVSQEHRPGYERNLTQWGNYNTPTFVQLHPNTDLEKLSANLDALVQKYLGDRLERWRKESVRPVPPDVKLLEYTYTNLPDIHLKTEVGWDKVSDPQYSWILGGIAVLILLIACINYISLALTTSASRRTEVGIRKVAGAQKNQLVYQFGFESILLALISMIFGIGLVFLFLPSFNEFTGKGIQLTGTNLVSLLAFSAGVAVMVGIVAGSYPAFFLSGFRPALVLKGRFTSKLHAGFTKPLVIAQFALSSFLIISSVIMYRQMSYITTKDLGYNNAQILVIPTHTGWKSLEADNMVVRYRTALQKEHSVISIAGTTASFNRGFSRYGYRIDDEQRTAYAYGVDPFYLSTLGIDLVLGRNFDDQIPTDSNAVIVNEALVRDMKWDDPLTEYLNWKEDSTTLGAKVIGVVKDYHFLSLEQNIEPMFLSMDRGGVGNLTEMLVKIAPGNIPGSVEALRKVWKEVSPNTPFDYYFMDEDVAKQYDVYKRWMKIMGLSTAFAIMISCLGLFGLAGINALNRTKEIGIRKVMGAELGNIFLLLNKQYVWLAFIAFVAAAPASWYVMNQWLSDFKFAITIGWELFALSMAGGLLIALLSVSYHAIRTALINPAQTLKYE